MFIVITESLLPTNPGQPEVAKLDTTEELREYVQLAVQTLMEIGFRQDQHHKDAVPGFVYVFRKDVADPGIRLTVMKANQPN